MAAKAALNFPHANLGIPHTNPKFPINKYIMSNWQDEWNDAGVNKLHSVKLVLGEWQSSYRWLRRDEVIVCHSCIGHTYKQLEMTYLEMKM